MRVRISGARLEEIQKPRTEHCGAAVSGTSTSSATCIGLVRREPASTSAMSATPTRTESQSSLMSGGRVESVSRATAGTAAG